jgi:uncharacterized protein
VTLGLCSLKDLNDAVDKARRKAAREDAAKKKAKVADGDVVDADDETPTADQSDTSSDEHD